MGKEFTPFAPTHSVSSQCLMHINTDVIEYIKNEVIRKIVEIEMSRSELSSSDKDHKNAFLFTKIIETGRKEN